ncbi:substrate-binding periplasmic protein [Thalassotalea montiporae]
MMDKSKQGWPIALIVAAAFACFSSLSFSQQLKVQIVTEHLAPLQINVPNQPPSGAMVEIVERLLNDSEIEGEIKFYPWARAYQIAQQQANTLIFSIVRTPSREGRFHWLFPLVNDSVHLVRLKSRPELTISTLEQAKQYRIGVHRSDIIHQYLQAKGFTDDHNILLNSSYASAWLALLERKVDYITANKFMWQAQQQTSHEAFQAVESALILDDLQQGHYLAASLNTSPIIIKKLQKALEKLKQSGQYLAILQKWQLAD